MVTKIFIKIFFNLVIFYFYFFQNLIFFLTLYFKPYGCRVIRMSHLKCTITPTHHHHPNAHDPPPLSLC